MVSPSSTIAGYLWGFEDFPSFPPKSGEAPTLSTFWCYMSRVILVAVSLHRLACGSGRDHSVVARVKHVPPPPNV
jgi:hypothetical protein